jgi:hypothetical protein
MERHRKPILTKNTGELEYRQKLKGLIGKRIISKW